MTYQRACAASDLIDGEPLGVVLGDDRVALVRDGETIYAIADECSHGRILLSVGFYDPDERSLECIGHGSRFDLATGRPLNLPANVAVPIYPTTTSGEDVLVDLDNPIQER